MGCIVSNYYGKSQFQNNFNFEKFDEYIQKYYKTYDTNGWVIKILGNSKNEAEAFDIFFISL